MASSSVERFTDKYIVCPSGCWIWIGATNGQQEYGQFCADGKRLGAHVWSYRQFSGKRIPRGYDVHHRCLVTLCVNWRHVVPVPPATNQKYRRRRKCRRHHERYRKHAGRRVCLSCNRERTRGWRARVRAAASKTTMTTKRASV